MGLLTATTAVVQAGTIPDGGVRLAPTPGPDVCHSARLAASAGFPWVSASLSWASAEPTPNGNRVSGTPGSAYVAMMRSFAACAQAAGVKVQIVLLDSPQWASGRGGTNDPPTTDHVADFGEFMGELAAAMGPFVDAWTPWNEPNFDFQWAPPHDVGRYVAMQKAAYTAVKAQDPTSLVTSAPIVGTPTGSATSAWDYLGAMYDAGIKGYADVIGLNFYPRTAPGVTATDSRGRPAPWALASQTYMRQLVDRYDPGRPIWIMETTYSTCVRCNTTADNAVDEATQAARIVDIYTYRRTHLQDVTDRIFWYDLRDHSTNRSDWYANQGLIRFDWSAKPAWRALGQAQIPPASAVPEPSPPPAPPPPPPPPPPTTTSTPPPPPPPPPPTTTSTPPPPPPPPTTTSTPPPPPPPTTTSTPPRTVPAPPRPGTTTAATTTSPRAGVTPPPGVTTPSPGEGSGGAGGTEGSSGSGQGLTTGPVADLVGAASRPALRIARVSRSDVWLTVSVRLTNVASRSLIRIESRTAASWRVRSRTRVSGSRTIRLRVALAGETRFRLRLINPAATRTLQVVRVPLPPAR